MVKTSKPENFFKYFFFVKVLLFLSFVSHFETKALVNTEKPSFFKKGMEDFEKNSLPEAEISFLNHIQTNPRSYAAFYNLGVLYQKTNRPIKAIASFRQALLLRNSFFKSEVHQNLKHLGAPVGFWFFIPHELFYTLISISLFLLFFSIQKWKVVFLSLVLFLSTFFFYFDSQPRFTALQSVLARSAPYEKASSVFTLSAGTWVRGVSSKNNKWVQIKSKNQGIGWVSRLDLF